MIDFDNQTLEDMLSGKTPVEYPRHKELTQDQKDQLNRDAERLKDFFRLK
jgi:hypothetical protein